MQRQLELKPLYGLADSTNDEVFSNVQFDDFSLELIAKGKKDLEEGGCFLREEDIKKEGPFLRYAVVGFVAKNEQKDSQPILYLRVRPGLGPPKPSEKILQRAEKVFGKGNFVVAKNTAGTGIVHRDTISQVDEKEPDFGCRVITGLSFTIYPKGRVFWANRSSINGKSFTKDPLALACFEFTPNNSLQEYNNDSNSLAYDLCRAIPELPFMKMATSAGDILKDKLHLRSYTPKEWCHSFIYEKQWQEIMELEKDEQVKQISNMLMRNIYIYCSLDINKENLSQNSRHRIKYLINIAKKHGIPLDINTIPQDFNAETKGATALIMAAKKGHVEVIKLLLENKANMELTDNKGNTAIMTALAYDQTKVVELLLEHGAVFDLNKTLQEALKNKANDSMIQWLFKKASTTESADFYITDFKKYTNQLVMKEDYELIGQIFSKNYPENFLQSLRRALSECFLEYIQEGNINKLHEIYIYFPADEFQKLVGKNALIEAEKGGDTRISLWLQEQTINLNDEKYSPAEIKNATTFLFDIIQGNYDKLSEYDKAIIHLDIIHPIYKVNIEEKIFETIEYLFQQDQYEPLIKLFDILSKHSFFQNLLSHKNAEGDSLLLMAVKSGYPNIVQQLLEFGADEFITEKYMTEKDEKSDRTVLLTDGSGKTVVQIAVENRSWNTLTVLLCCFPEKNFPLPIPLNQLDFNGYKLPAIFAQLKPYTLFEPRLEAAENLYEKYCLKEEHDSRSRNELESIILILGEVIPNLKNLNACFMQLLHDSLVFLNDDITQEMQEKLQSYLLSAEQIQVIQHHLHTLTNIVKLKEFYAEINETDQYINQIIQKQMEENISDEKTINLMQHTINDLEENIRDIQAKIKPLEELLSASSSDEKKLSDSLVDIEKLLKTPVVSSSDAKNQFSESTASNSDINNQLSESTASSSKNKKSVTGSGFGFFQSEKKDERPKSSPTIPFKKGPG